MAFDLDKFLAEDLKLSGDSLGAVRTALSSADTIAALEKSVQRQADYSRNMDALKRKETELAAADARVNAELAEVARIQAEGGQVTQQQLADLTKARTRVFELEQHITRLAGDAGVDPKTILGDGAPAVPPTTTVTPTAVDTSKFLDRDTFGNVNQYMFNLNMELPIIAQEHFDLTGERLDTRKLGAEIIKRANTKGANADPRVVWETLFEIPAKREAKATEKFNADLAKAREEGRQAGLSEAGLPGSGAQRAAHPSAHPSPVLHRVGADGNPVVPVAQRQQAQSSLQGAAASLRSHRYAGWQKGQPQPAAAGA